MPQNEMQRHCADVVSPRLLLEHPSKSEVEPQPARGPWMVANCATAPIACRSVSDGSTQTCRLSDMSTQTCRSSARQEDGISADEAQDYSARLLDVQQKFKELRLTMLADVELKLQEHTAYLRTLLVEEVALQIRTTRPGTADADDGTAAVTGATSRAVGQVDDEDGFGELAKLSRPCSPSNTLQEDTDILEVHGQAPDPRAETQKRLSAIEKQLRSRERDAKVPGVMGSVDRLHSAAVVATMATGFKHAKECEALTEKLTFSWQNKLHLGLTFLDPDEADAKLCSEEKRAPALSSPLPPSHRPHEATDHSPSLSTIGSRSARRRQTCTQRFASPELADILERRRSISEGQIAHQAYGAFMSARSKKKP